MLKNPKVKVDIAKQQAECAWLVVSFFVFEAAFFLFTVWHTQ